MKKILIVEDQYETRKLISIALRLSPFELIEAPNGVDAIQAAREQAPDIMLLDIVMGDGMDGFQVCKRIKSDARLKHIYVILVSGLSAPEDFRMGEICGADAYFVKPFRLARLAEVVTNHARLKGTFISEATP